MTRIAILGSGMAAFGAAHKLHELGHAPTLFEKQPYYGGHTASFSFHGFTVDEGPHVSFTKDERIKELLASNIDQKYEIIRAKVNNLWKGHWIKHPAQVNLHGLPTDLIVQIIKDFAAANHAPPGEIKNYKDWLYASFGKTFAENFPMAYAHKYHTTTADNMSTDWLGPRLYKPSMDEVLRGALSPKSADVHYVDQFRYPSRGGFKAYLKAFADKANLKLGHEMASIDPRRKSMRFGNGSEAEYDHLISSVPLTELIPRIQGTPRDVLDAAEKLACTQLVLVNVGVRRRDMVEAHWSYFYDKEVFFTRLSTPHLLSPHNAPDGCGCLQAECYYSKKYRPLPHHPDGCIEPAIESMRATGLLRDSDEVVFKNTLFIPYANIIFDLDRAAAVATVHDYLRSIGVQWCGRYGDWGYLWTDEAFISGENAGGRVAELARK